MKKYLDKKIIRISFVILWMSFIFFMSNQNGNESSNQSDFISELIYKLGIHFNEQYKGIVTFLIRKTAHLSEYFILALLVYAVIVLYKCISKTKLVSICIVFLYACTDEIHQLFVVGREGAFRDVIIDTCGGIIALLIISLLSYFNARKSELK